MCDNAQSTRRDEIATEVLRDLRARTLVSPALFTVTLGPTFPAAVSAAIRAMDEVPNEAALLRISNEVAWRVDETLFGAVEKVVFAVLQAALCEVLSKNKSAVRAAMKRAGIEKRASSEGRPYGSTTTDPDIDLEYARRLAEEIAGRRRRGKSTAGATRVVEQKMLRDLERNGQAIGLESLRSRIKRARHARRGR